MAEKEPGSASLAPVSGLGPLPALSATPPLSAIPPLAAIPPLPAPGASKAKVTPVDVGGYWLNHYKHCGQTECDYCGLEAAGFAAAMHQYGHKTPVLRGDQDASPAQWRAATDQNPGGVDTVEFAYLATHGSTHGKLLKEPPSIQPKNKYVRWYLATFDKPGGCIVSSVQLDPNTWQPPDPTKPVTTMRLGEGRLRWVVIDACRSLQVGLENEHEQAAMAELAEADPGDTWGRCYAGVHMFFGFTGLSSDASWTRERGIAFGKRAGRGEALSDSWLDEAYSSWEDDVPVVTAFAQSAQELDQRLKGESLKAVVQPSGAPVQGYMFASMWRS